jgi:colicin import membrane protein
MASQAYVQSVLWFDHEEQAQFFRRLGRALLLSLVVHLIILLVVTVLRLPQRGERPLAAVEVSLVSLSTPVPVKQPEPLKAVAQPRTPEPKSIPAPAVKATTPAHAPATPAGHVARDVLQGLQLPPDAPKFGELAPAKFVAPPQQEAKVKVAELPRIPDPIAEPVAKVPRRSTLSDEMDRELEEELKKVKQFTPAAKLEIPKEVHADDLPVKPALQQEVKVPAAQTPETTLKISGSSGSNPYWARVQAVISSQWEPPPIDVSGQTYSVIIKFRLQRNGMIKDVAIQKTSGNSYYDMAGQRAVLRPRQLPPFPADMTDGYKDIEMVFRVGEPAG